MWDLGYAASGLNDLNAFFGENEIEVLPDRGPSRKT